MAVVRRELELLKHRDIEKVQAWLLWKKEVKQAEEARRKLEAERTAAEQRRRVEAEEDRRQLAELKSAELGNIQRWAKEKESMIDEVMGLLDGEVNIPEIAAGQEVRAPDCRTSASRHSTTGRRRRRTSSPLSTARRSTC